MEEYDQITLMVTVQSKKAISLQEIIQSQHVDKDELVDAINNNDQQRLTEIIDNIRESGMPNHFYGEIQTFSVEMENPEVSININSNILVSNTQ